MKTIGIITLVFNNYGTKLQTYSLCKVLEQLGYKPEVFNLKSSWGGFSITTRVMRLLIGTVRGYGLKSICKFIELFRWWRYMHVHTPDEKTASLLKQRDASFCLINRLIPYSEKFYTFDDIRKGNYPICDEYLVGSDQTWNGLKVADQDVYMLDFLGGKKGYTYAVSFGITRIPSGMIGDYKRRIQNFHSLLVRETESVELCNSLGRNDAQLVLDPTLLLSENEYAPVYENKELVDGKFILVYSLNHSLKIYKEAYALAKREGCKMVMLKRDFCPPLPEEFDNSIELYDVSVGGFLWLIKNAECVITNSYHALLFSINMNRFFYLYLDNSDEENSRLLTTVGILGLKDRVFWETDYLPRTICPIEYDAVNDRLSEKRQHSINLLRESLLRN